MKHFVMILVACLAVLCVQPIEAATISLSPVADGDAYTVDYSPWDLDITGPVLHVYLDVGNNFEARAALEFDLDSIPGGSTIAEATLWLYKAELMDFNVGVYGYEGDGIITEYVFMFDPPVIVEFAPLDVNAIDVTAFVSDLINSDKNYAGFQLRELMDVDGTSFYSSDSSEIGLRPRLDIKFASVPEPSTLLLLGSGIIGLVGFGRKKFRK